MVTYKSAYNANKSKIILSEEIGWGGEKEERNQNWEQYCYPQSWHDILYRGRIEIGSRVP